MIRLLKSKETITIVVPPKHEDIIKTKSKEKAKAIGTLGKIKSFIRKKIQIYYLMLQ